jgi:hypothetical protein
MPEVDVQRMAHDDLVTFAVERDSAFDRDASRPLLGTTARRGVFLQRVALALELFALPQKLVELAVLPRQPLHERALRFVALRVLQVFLYRLQVFLRARNRFLEPLQQGFDLTQVGVALRHARVVALLRDDLQTAHRAVTVEAAVVQLQLLAEVILLGLKIVNAEKLSVEVAQPLELGHFGAVRAVVVAGGHRVAFGFHEALTPSPCEFRRA